MRICEILAGDNVLAIGPAGSQFLGDGGKSPAPRIHSCDDGIQIEVLGKRVDRAAEIVALVFEPGPQEPIAGDMEAVGVTGR